MSLMISKTFEGEPRFPNVGWGVIGKKVGESDESTEVLIMVRPDDQRSVAEYLAEVLSSQRPAPGIEIPEGASGFDEYVTQQVRLERTLERRNNVATAIYAPE